MDRSLNTLRTLFVCLLGGLWLIGCATKGPEVQVRPPHWQLNFEHPIEFQILVDEDLLVAGTARHLYGLEPKTGRRLWRMRNVHASAGDLMSVGDAPYILIGDAAGGRFGDADTNMLAVSRRRGEILWESSLLEGRVLQASADPVHGILYVIAVPRAHGDDRGALSSILPGKGLFSGLKREPQLHALELSTGRQLWQRPYGKKVTLRPSYPPTLDVDADWIYNRPFTLGMYHPPSANDGWICVTYTGMQCFDGRSGTPLWKRKFDVLEDNLALSYARPIFDGETVFTSGGNRVRAFDLRTGKPLWRSRRFDLIPELLTDRNVIYAQLGGRFFNIKKETWVWKGDFGAAAFDKRTGKTLWKYKLANGSITNLLVFGDRVWFADRERLIGIDRRSGALRVEYEHQLESGPVFIGLNEDRRILLVGEEEVAAYHEITGKRLWYARHPKIGPSGWRRFSSSLLNTSGKVLKLGSFLVANVGGLLPAIPALSLGLGGVNVKLINTKSLVADKTKRTGRRFTYQASSLSEDESYANLRGGYQYFITRPKGHDHALAVVNLRSGETERLVGLPSKYPNVVIDELNGNIYQAFGKRLVALPLLPGR